MKLGEALVAGAPEIGFGLLRFEQDALGLLDDLAGSASARAVAEHADADVDLVGPRIGIAHGDQLQQRIALHGRQVGQPAGARIGFGQHAVRLARS